MYMRCGIGIKVLKTDNIQQIRNESENCDNPEEFEQLR